MKLQSLIFPLMFVAPAFLMVSLAAYVAGGATLICQRIEPTQIDCTVSNQRWFGMVDAGTTKLKQLEGAHLESYECDDTDSNGHRVTKQCERLALDTSEGIVHPDLLTDSASEVNHFITSEDRTLTIYNNRWIFSAAASGFALLWIGAGSFFFRQIKAANRF